MLLRNNYSISVFYEFLCRDSVDLRALHESGRLQLVLVDHHVMAKDTEFLRGSVVEIVDHHPQDSAWVWPSSVTTLRKVGSCCTLVAEKVLQSSPKLLNCQIASLLYGELYGTGRSIFTSNFLLYCSSIHKKGDRMDCNNYRGISLLSISHKILSNILLSRM